MHYFNKIITIPNTENLKLEIIIMNSTKGNKKKIFQADGTNHKSVNTSAIRPISPLD